MRLAAALLLLCGTHALTTTTAPSQPVVWSLAGSDSSAGAGVEADLRAFRCLGARGCAVVTALTAQSTTGVQAVLETPAAHVAATIAALEADLPPAAVKTGALGGAATRQRRRGNVVGGAAVLTRGEALPGPRRGGVPAVHRRWVDAGGR